MVDQNSEFLCTFRACCEQDTIREFVGRVVGTDCLVLSGPHFTPSVRVVVNSDLTKHYLFAGVLGYKYILWGISRWIPPSIQPDVSFNLTE